MVGVMNMDSGYTHIANIIVGTSQAFLKAVTAPPPLDAI
jgi:hypothetical protein